MFEEYVKCDYSIIDNELIIEYIFVEEENRKKGYASAFLNELERIAKENNCDKMLTPSDLSKIAISFWLKNGFNTDEDKEILNLVLSSKKSYNHIFDDDYNSVVVLYKNIKQC